MAAIGSSIPTTKDAPIARSDRGEDRSNEISNSRSRTPPACEGRNEKLDIPVSGQVVGDISVRGLSGWNEDQGVLVIGSVKSSEGAHGKVNLVVRGADASNVKFQLKSVEPKELKITIGQPQKLKDTLVQVPVDIEIPPGTPPMVHLDTQQGDAAHIVFSTTHPKVKELSMGVRFAVER